MTGTSVGYDVVVVGAGSAGCVLAARFSEDPACSVLLLEAGPDHPDDALPAELLSAADIAFTHDWGYQSEPTATGRQIGLVRARVVGGCSAINACFAMRGDASVYDEWAALGNVGWSFDDLLPSFRALETDLDRPHDPWHGDRGPLVLRRYAHQELSPVQRAFLEACAAAGHPVEEDLNRPHPLGAGRAVTNAVDGIRGSAARSHLAPARQRPNLTVRGGAEVDRVLLAGGRATGVRLVGGEEVAAAEVVLAAGAYASPALLLRSGIGPAEELRELGVDVIVDLPGVGRGLVEHPVVWSWAATHEPAPSGSAAFQTVMLLATADEPDLHVFPRAATGDGTVFGLATSVMRPVSRGSVRLSSSDPQAAPRIDPAFLVEDDDLRRAVAGIDLCRELLSTSPLSALVAAEVAPGEADLRAYARSDVTTYFHPVGTCRMGPASDATAVVDALGRVRGVEELSVVDASIMPTIPSANTNLPSMAVAERVVELRRAQASCLSPLASAPQAL